MTITTISLLRSGMRPIVPIVKAPTNLAVMQMTSTWGRSGNPIAGTFDTTLNGVVLSSTSAQVTGQIFFTDPASGNAHLAKFQAGFGATNAFSGANVLLCDRLWHNGGFDATSTSAQTITSPTWPARDENGATTGAGVLLGLEISAVMGAATPNISVSYTNTAAASGRAGVALRTGITASAAGMFYPISLQAGDVGVKSVESLTLDASWISGTMNLVAYRVLAFVGAPIPNVPSSVDGITAALPRMYNGTVPFLLTVSQGTGANILSGEVAYTHG